MQTTTDLGRLMRMKPGTMLLPGLSRIRVERGLSIRKLASVAGVSHDTVWRLETLQRGAEPETRRKLARALGVGIRDLRKTDEEDAEM